MLGLPLAKEEFRIHKSDINTSKVRCGVANHLLNVCRWQAQLFSLSHGLNNPNEWYTPNGRG